MVKNTQQLGRRFRNTYTPTGAAPASSNCDSSLKVPRGKDSVASLKTLPNNSEEHLTDLGMSDMLILLARVKLPPNFKRREGQFLHPPPRRARYPCPCVMTSASIILPRKLGEKRREKAEKSDSLPDELAAEVLFNGLEHHAHLLYDEGRMKKFRR